MNVTDAVSWFRQTIIDAGIDFIHPNPEVVWELFKRFAIAPIVSAGGPECEELWFEASDGDPIRGSPGYFDFVRQFLQDTEKGIEWHEQITAHFTCESSVKLGLRGTIHAENYSDLQEFFKAVEGSESFRFGLNFTGWSFEVRVDAC